MEDDHLGAGRLGDAGGVVEHANRHPVLLAAIEVPEERRERRVHGQDEVAIPREPAELAAASFSSQKPFSKSISQAV